MVSLPSPLRAPTRCLSAGQRVSVVGQAPELMPQLRARFLAEATAQLPLQGADNRSSAPVSGVARWGWKELPHAPVHSMRAPLYESGALRLVDGKGDALRRQSKLAG